jgi:hypothetical protein
MKVRRKNGCFPEATHNVVEESEHYYICNATPFDNYVLRKDDCEPIPTETWRDVTGECEIQNGRLVHGMYFVENNPDYRRRKVPTHDLYMTNHQMAFIIEKRDA